VTDSAGNSHVFYHPRVEDTGSYRGSVAYTMLGPDGSTKIATTTIVAQAFAVGPVQAALTGSGKVLMVYNQGPPPAQNSNDIGDGEGHYVVLDPSKHPQNGTRADTSSPFVAMTDTVYTTKDNLHSHQAQLA